jgi:UDP-N-acetylglucosamine 2-epimerase (non-hydrolysing)
VLLVTLHRRESFGEPMARVGRALARLADQRPDLAVVVPLHLNPAVRDVVLPLIAGRPGIVVVPPLDYGSFARLLDRADVVLTDSGGIQEEAPSRGKPVLVLRDTTERPEAVAAGTVALVGTDEQRIVAEVGRLLDDPDAYRAMARAVNPYGDGRAAPRTVGALRWFFGLGERPGEFTAEAASAAPPQMASLEGAHR